MTQSAGTDLPAASMICPSSQEAVIGQLRNHRHHFVMMVVRRFSFSSPVPYAFQPLIYHHHHHFFYHPTSSSSSSSASSSPSSSPHQVPGDE
jgi:hypothetical protein